MNDPCYCEQRDHTPCLPWMVSVMPVTGLIFHSVLFLSQSIRAPQIHCVST